jgi:hypothetical protein
MILRAQQEIPAFAVSLHNRRYSSIPSDSELRFVDARHNGKLKVRFSLFETFGMSNRTGELINIIRLQSGLFDKAPFIVGLESSLTYPRIFLSRHLRLTAAIEFLSSEMRDFESHKQVRNPGHDFGFCNHKLLALIVDLTINTDVHAPQARLMAQDP